MSHVSVLKEDVSAVAATSIINTPCAGVGGKVDGFIPPLLDLHSPSPMSPHLSPRGSTLLLPFFSSSISKEAPTPHIAGWKGCCWGGPDPRFTWEWVASLRRVP